MIRARSKSSPSRAFRSIPTRTCARAKLRQVLTFYNIADHYSDMLRGMGFDKEVTRFTRRFKRAASKPPWAR